MTNCTKCRTHIKTHLWVIHDKDGMAKTYCSPSCQRNGKSQFEKLYKALSR